MPAATTRGMPTCSSVQRWRARSRTKAKRYRRSDGRTRQSSSSGIASTPSQRPGSSWRSSQSVAEIPAEQTRELAGNPGRDVHAVGDGGHRPAGLGHVGPHRREHRARHLAVQLADRVGRAGRSDGERGHVELRAAAVVVGAERQEAIAMRPERPPAAGEMLLDEVKRKRVVAGRHRRVRREDRGLPDLLERVVERRPLLDQVADPLQHDEAGVAFVQMKDPRRHAERLQRPDAADAEDDLLLDARLAIAAVQARRQLAVPGRVLFEIGVEQIQLHAAEAHAPDRHQHRAIAERHRGDARLAVRRQRRLDRRVGPVQPLVALFLPAFGGDVLVEVALRIHEPDADERHAEVARFLAVIAGEHAETAGVDRQRLVQRELGGEVGDRPAELRKAARPPGVARAARARRARRSPGRRARGTPGRRRPVRAARAAPARSMRTGLCAVARHSA